MKQSDAARFGVYAAMKQFQFLVKMLGNSYGCPAEVLPDGYGIKAIFAKTRCKNCTKDCGSVESCWLTVMLLCNPDKLIENIEDGEAAK